MNIILLAPPAAGKGTQSLKIVSKYGLTHISTGDLLRESLKRHDELSDQIREVMNRGALVSDEIILRLIEDVMSSTEHGIIFDGFPRNLNQAKKYEELLTKLGQSIDLVLYLEISKEEAEKRIVGRRTCSNCGKVYNTMIEREKPLHEETCDVCETALTHREDDNVSVFRLRYETYMNETEPLIHFYEEKGLLKRIDASLESEEVFHSIVEVMDSLI